MADTELNSKLYEKMSAEQDKYREWLMDQPPADTQINTERLRPLLMKRRRRRIWRS